MNKLIIGGAVAMAMSTTSLSASPLLNPSADHAAQPAQVWLAKSDKANGNGNGNGGQKILKRGNGNAGHAHAAKDNRGNGNADKGNAGKGNSGKGNSGKGKPDHAGGAQNGNASKANAQAANEKPGKGNAATPPGQARKTYTEAERTETVTRLMSTPAPDGRNMVAIIGATALALAAPDLVVSDTPTEELITYRNCPPGLAKKDPPCVPPGLAKQGVSFDEWAAYDADRYETIWLDRRADFLQSEVEITPNPDLLLLQSDQIQTLFDLDPPAEGYRYGLIDGLPVLLDEEDYASLQLVNQLAQVADLAGIPIAPTAALTQPELVQLYRLPTLEDGQNYAVVNGQIVQMDDSNYELLQMIRVARAIL